jgi:effector-binding domain-containing protein
MPLEQVKVVLTATDPTVRDEVITDHLRGMERQLEQTKATVASLRQLLEGGGSPSAGSADVAFRTLADAPALLVSGQVVWDDVPEWLLDTFADLHRELGSDADLRGGPDGALYSAEMFESHIGEVAAFIPLNASAGRVVEGLLPEGRVAVAVHRGPLSELDRTYAALGSFVAEQGLGSRARTTIRENYLGSLLDNDDEHGLVTEVCWPVLSMRGEKEL